jgi:hypothetical protein
MEHTIAVLAGEFMPFRNLAIRGRNLAIEPADLFATFAFGGSVL